MLLDYNRTDQAALHTAAQRVIAGGILGTKNMSPDGPRPIFSQAKGAYLTDVSGKTYLDYCLGHGAMFLGHSHPVVQAALTEQLERGVHFYAYLNPQAIALAEKLVEHVPSAETVRFVTSGSEATSQALRIARAFTGRQKVLKFEGGYNGNHDYAMQSTTPDVDGNYPQAQPDSDGIPASVSGEVLVAPFNDLEITRSIVEQNPSDIAAILIEPLQRLILTPEPEFLSGLRALADEFGIVLIFDEVLSCFRHGLGCAQARLGVTPDLTTLGKIIGGGIGLAAIVGRRNIMSVCGLDARRSGKYAFLNGTFFGAPLGCAAALAVLSVLEDPSVYGHVNEIGAELLAGLQNIVKRLRIDAIAYGDGPTLHLIFAEKKPRNYADILRSDRQKLVNLHRLMLADGVFIDPGQRVLISAAHTHKDVQLTLDCFDRSLRRLS